jgi:cytochrome c-type biogenesis protein
MSAEVSFAAAFVAGLLSIASPCVLPLIPIYLAHLAGISAGQDVASTRRRVLANAVAYVLGFSLVFVLLGVALGAAGVLVETGELVAGNRLWLVRIGGALVLLLGLHQLGIVRIPLLDRERRLPTDRLPAGQVSSSFVIGMTFGAGWSPCVGPILGAILTMAAGQGSVERAAALLAVYSAGLAVPFLLTAVAFGRATTAFRWLRDRYLIVTAISGCVLVAMGVLLFTGELQRLNIEAQNALNNLGINFFDL